MNKEFSLKTKNGDYIHISAYGYENISVAPCLILVHGFKGFKDWGFFPYTAKYFAEKGYFVITFNFSHNGVADSNDSFSEVEKFAKNTVSLEISELVQIINAYKNLFFGGKVFGKIGLIGHSRGGGIVLLSSFIEKNVDCYVVWASVERFDRYTERQKAEWRNAGYIEVQNSRTKQLMRLNIDLLEDIETNKFDSHNIELAVKKLDKELLIIHGEQDLTVPISEGEHIFESRNKKITVFYKIPAAGHTFDIVHPFEGSNNKFNSVLLNTEQFLNNIFTKKSISN